MRVLYVIAMYGAEYLGNIIHRELGHEFQKHGHTFEVFALASAQELAGRAAKRVEEGIRVYRGLAAGRLGPDLLNALTKPFLHYERFGAGWVSLKRYLAHQAPYDVVLAEGAYPFGVMCALAKRDVPLVITVAGGDFIDHRLAQYGYGRFRTARALMRWTWQHAAAIRVTTPLVRERILALGAPATRLALIPRNIATYCYPPPQVSLEAWRAQARRALAEKYALGNAHVIAAVGRMLPIKGFDLLVRALPTILQNAGDTRALFIGPNRIVPQQGDYQSYLTHLARTLNVADKVIFTGAIEHRAMRDILAGVDVLAVPSLLEGMNKVVVEGAAVGTPSIVSRGAGIADWVQQAGAGEIVAAGDYQALAQSLVRLLCQPSLRAEYAVRGIEFAAQFSTERVGRALIQLCQQVA